MSCCGGMRNEWRQYSSMLLSKPPASAQVNKKMWPDVYFEYTGPTALTVIGNVTGKRYRFQKKGDRQLIDYRDASGMRSIQVLKKLEAKK